MKPVISATKTSITTMDFYPTSLHPDALWIEWRKDDVMIRQGAVHKDTLDGLIGVVDFFQKSADRPRRGREASLPKNAIFWPVPNYLLEQADAELTEYAFKAGELRDAPDHTLVYFSLWDHRVWDVTGAQILVPVKLRLWETRFDLAKVESHLKNVSGVISFNIVPNKCVQNWDNSGRVIGELTIWQGSLKVPTNIDLTRGWIEDNVLHRFGGSDLDLLGLHQFLRERPY